MPRDPLDAITAVVCTSVGGAAYAAAVGNLVPAAVVAGVSALAYVAAPRRRFPTAEAVCGDVAGKVALVTGATNGIGEETARVLALKGCHVVIAARSTSKLEASRKKILESCAKAGTQATVTCLELDLSDLDSVRACAASFRALKLPLDLLINNAGVMAIPSRESTKQGLEMQVGVCHVAHFLLTQLLLPELEKAAPSRVVCLSSKAVWLHAGASMLADPKLETTPYDPWKAYGNAKLSNLLFAHELNARYSAKGVTAYSVHPGGIHTGLQGHVNPYLMFKWLIVTPLFFKSIEQGAATTVVCATQAQSAGAGEYFEDCKPTSVAGKILKDLGADAGERLWKSTEALLQ